MVSLRELRKTAAVKAQLCRRTPRCVILMGLPGSGKSAFSHSLVSDHHNGIDVEKRRENHKYYIINQNKMEEKTCIALAGSLSKYRRVRIDICKLTESERVDWIDILHSPADNEAVLIYFANDISIFILQVVDRNRHETIPQGRGGRIVTHMYEKIRIFLKDRGNRNISIHSCCVLKRVICYCRSGGSNK